MRYLFCFVSIMTICHLAGAQSNENLVGQAILKFEAGDYAASLTDIEEALASQDDLAPKERAQAHLYRGRLYLRQELDSINAGQTDAMPDAKLRALEHYLQAREHDDGSMTAVIQQQLNQLYGQLFNAGAQAYNNSRSAEGSARTALLEEAAKYVEGAYQIRPDNYMVSDLLGRTHYLLEQYDQALGYYLNARRQYRPIRSREPDFSAITNIFLSSSIIFEQHLTTPSLSRALESVQAGLALLDTEYGRYVSNFSSNSKEGHQRYVNGKKDLWEQEFSLLMKMPDRRNEAVTKFESAVEGDFKDDDRIHVMYALLVQDRDIDKAIELYTRASQINPQNQT
ncbi:MAG: hypothetical protein R3301_15620, partial [Saprospiraceae bacterium]|nr:hypothetical protein [Saprospiraceae bacterium]